MKHYEALQFYKVYYGVSAQVSDLISIPEDLAWRQLSERVRAKVWDRVRRQVERKTNIRFVISNHLRNPRI